MPQARQAPRWRRALVAGGLQLAQFLGELLLEDGLGGRLQADPIVGAGHVIEGLTGPALVALQPAQLPGAELRGWRSRHAGTFADLA